MNEKALTPSQIDACRTQLLEEKNHLEKLLTTEDDFGLSESQREQTQELSMVDNHPADTATDLTERSKDLALMQHSQLQLEQVYEALSRIQTGTYGICQICHDFIAAERMLVIPTALTCRAHTEDHPPLNRRPVEESVLFPAAEDTLLESRSNRPEVDDTDAWQIVESWGTYDSPAYAENSSQRSDHLDSTDLDEHEGFVEPIESFVASDITGQNVHFYRNKAYQQYMQEQDNHR